ncbi:YceI family protein [Anaeromyxobacter paludicola]|uniref:Polyisoprenoid-binding protein n=1 Tax=Anaeromyxobacter paludicola TaxID=2918171 RepID=A0ABM7XB97_9BACT|nr:YceI family protein [Anaeromyxobacter paludicola]BDG09125.1 polyisoprenoid-binding protein [Anaeromyxobacter paludicola]
MANATWDIDVSHSAIHFWVRHMIISKVHGRFAKWSGAVSLDPQDPTKGSVEVHIDAASIDTQVADRDAHLRSADFLDAASFPELTFRSKAVARDGEALRIVGDLTIRGVTREVTLQAEFAGTGKDPWGNERAGFSAKASLDRRDYGLTWNAALEAGGVLVGEKVEISIELEAIRKAGTVAA